MDAAGADGVEFARAAEIDFGLAWGGLFGGDIRLTHVNLDQPVILAEIGPDGSTSWSPRRAFPVDRWTSATQAISETNGDAAPVAAALYRGGDLRLRHRQCEHLVDRTDVRPHAHIGSPDHVACSIAGVDGRFAARLAEQVKLPLRLDLDVGDVVVRKE